MGAADSPACIYRSVVQAWIVSSDVQGSSGVTIGPVGSLPFRNPLTVLHPLAGKELQKARLKEDDVAVWILARTVRRYRIRYMRLLTELAYWEIQAFLTTLFAVVCVQLLTRQINTRGLFLGRKGDGTRYFSAERVQLRLFTRGAVFQILSEILRDPVKFPAVSGSWLLLPGGSHLVFLGGKLRASFLGKS